MRSPFNLELASFKKHIRNGAFAYSILRDECYFDKFQRELCIAAKSYDVSEILDPTFTPGPSQEEKELSEAKQTFMYKVFKETLLTDMGRTKVRMHHRATDAQAVWKEHSEYMITGSKGASEKRKLTQYVPTQYYHMLSGPGLSRVLIKGMLQLEGRKIISLIPKP